MAEPITVRCSSCDTAFPVDPDKVPTGGVNARCSECSDIFRVDDPAEAASEADPGGAPADAAGPGPSEGLAASEEDTGSEAAVASGGGAVSSVPETNGIDEDVPGERTSGVEALPDADEAPGLEKRTAVDGTPETDEASEVEKGTEVGETVPRPRFGQRTPEEKAQRLARVLVSDMITYNPELYETALARGTLEEDFEEEIEKSWEEYVEQVGDELANTTSYWRDALNEILARGEDVF